MKQKYKKSRRLKDSGYATCMLDPRTCEDHLFQFAVNTLFHRTLHIQIAGNANETDMRFDSGRIQNLRPH